MTMPKPGTPISSSLNGIIHEEYFSKVREVLGLNGNEVIVKKHDKLPWNISVYAVGGVEKSQNGKSQTARVAVAYRSPSAPKGEFDEHGNPVVAEQKIEGKYDEKSIVGFLESMIEGLRKKTDFPK